MDTIRVMKLYTSANTAVAVEGVSNWSITHSTDGSKSMSFDIPASGTQYSAVEEEAMIEFGGTIYRIKTINERDSASSVTAEIDLDDLREGMLLSFTTETQTLAQTLTAALDGTGWSFSGTGDITARRSLELTDVTPLDIIRKCTQKTAFNVSFAFDNVNKIISVTRPAASANNVFFSDQFNLKSLSFKGSSRKLITRLYAYGAEGLSFADINSGKAYVEDHTYTDKVISQVWRDERYTDKQSLLEAATEKLSELAVPERSYSCELLDFFHTGINSLIILVDRRRKKRYEYLVVEYKEYPEEPERNTVTLSKAPYRL